MTKPNNRNTQRRGAEYLDDAIAYQIDPRTHSKLCDEIRRREQEAELQELEGLDAAIQSSRPTKDHDSDKLLRLNKSFIAACADGDANEACRIACRMLKLSKEGLKNKPIFDFKKMVSFLFQAREKHQADIPKEADDRVEKCWPGRYLRLQEGMDIVRLVGPRDERLVALVVANFAEPYMEFLQNLLPEWARRQELENLPNPLFPLCEFCMHNSIGKAPPSKSRVNMLPSFGNVPDPAPERVEPGEPRTMLFGGAKILEGQPLQSRVESLDGWRRQIGWLREVYRRAHRVDGVSPSFAFNQLVGTILRLGGRYRWGPSQQRYMTRHEVGFDRCDQGKPRWVPLANCSARRLMNRRTHKCAQCFDGSTYAAISIP